MIHEVPLLQAEAQSVCYNCGDWTTQSADSEVVVRAAETAAEALADGLMTERQALAYLLREVAGLDRQTTADAMESTPSNVDNLQRRASEKVDAARDLVDGLETLESTTAPEETPEELPETPDADG